MNKKNKLILLSLTFLFFLSFPLASKAIITDTIGIVPAHPDPYVRFSDSWFFYNLNLGETKRDVVKLINNSDQTSVVRLMAEDGLATSDGSFALMPEDQKNRDMGNWIQLSANEVEVPPKSEKLIPFIITIPQNADVGDHMAGIAMQETEVADENAAPVTGFKIITRIGVRMYETIPGEIKKSFGITQLNYQYYPTGVNNFIKDFLDINKKTVFFIGIKNEGNVKINPLVTLNVKNIFGRTTVYKTGQEVGSVFPGGENKDSMVTWNGMPWLGRYTASITVDPQLQGLAPQTKEIVIWYFPYKIGFVLVLLAVIIILLRLIIKYQREVSKERMPIYIVKEGDSLAKLAEKFSLGWKKIARINELKKPFGINEGEKLFIPATRKNLEIMRKLLANSEMEPSIAYRSGKSGINKKKKFVMIAILVLIGGAAIYKYRTRTIHEVLQLPPQKAAAETRQETADKTRTGAFKKSSVKVEVARLIGDSESNRRLYEKFKIIGYNVSYADRTPEGKYSSTTIEYNPDKKDVADMIKNDINISENIDLKEVPNLDTVIIYNFAGKDEYFDAKPNDEPWWSRSLQSIYN